MEFNCQVVRNILNPITNYLVIFLTPVFVARPQYTYIFYKSQESSIFPSTNLVFTLIRVFWVFGFRWRGSCTVRHPAPRVILLHFTQIHIDGPFGAPDVDCDGVLERHRTSGGTTEFRDHMFSPIRNADVSRDISENLNSGPFLSCTRENLVLSFSHIKPLANSRSSNGCLVTERWFQSPNVNTSVVRAQRSLLRELADPFKESVLEFKKSVFWWQGNLKYNTLQSHM